MSRDYSSEIQNVDVDRMKSHVSHLIRQLAKLARQLDAARTKAFPSPIRQGLTKIVALSAPPDRARAAKDCASREISHYNVHRKCESSLIE
jgi:hypothetical protein